jgi:hypothetical protein
MIIINITPKMPEGKYPHPELYGHFGNAPIRNKIKRTIKIVPNINFSLINNPQQTSFYQIIIINQIINKINN